MKTTSTLFAVLLSAGTIFTSCKQNDKTSDSDAPVTEVSDSAAVVPSDSQNDDSFLADAATVNMEEIELGKLAQSRSMSKDVKDFGKMMVDGHTKSLNELKELATKKGITLPQGVSEKGKMTLDELTKADAKSFDKMYIDKMVEGHTETIAKFDDASKTATDADVKAWAAKTLPDLEMHLDHAVTVQQKIN